MQIKPAHQNRERERVRQFGLDSTKGPQNAYCETMGRRLSWPEYAFLVSLSVNPLLASQTPSHFAYSPLAFFPFLPEKLIFFFVLANFSFIHALLSAVVAITISIMDVF